MKPVLELRCPRCGATLSIKEERETLFCQHCGAKLYLTDDNTFTINKNTHTINDADIIREETARIVLNHKMEMDNKNNQIKEMNEAIKAIPKLLLAIAILVIFPTHPISSLILTFIIVLILVLMGKL